MVAYSGGQRGRPPGQAVVAEVEEAIDDYFISAATTDDVTRQSQKEYPWLQATKGRINRSRPVIPPLLELHLIQLGNKLTCNEAEIARARFKRAAPATATAAAATASVVLGQGGAATAPECLATTDPEGNTVQGRISSSSPSSVSSSSCVSWSVPRARCCNCPENDLSVADVVVDQLVHLMRKIVMDIMEDNATTSLLRARVSRQRVSASVREEQQRSFPSLTPSASCSSASSSSSSSFSKVAIITPVKNTSTPTNIPLVMDTPSLSPSPSCSSPSSLFSSPSSSSPTCEIKKEGRIRSTDTRLAAQPNEEDDQNLLKVTGDSVCQSRSPIRLTEIRQTDPIFLRCPSKAEENMNTSHCPIPREDSAERTLRTSSSPNVKSNRTSSAGDELQIRLNAILHSRRREGDVPRRCVSLRGSEAKVDVEQLPPPPSLLQAPSSYQLQVGTEQLEALIEAENSSDSSAYCDGSNLTTPFSNDINKFSRRGSSGVPTASPSSSSSSTCNLPGTSESECHSSWEEYEDDLQQSFSTPRYTIFTISGTLADPFGTNARYSLRSLSTAHF